jgi:enamine deaminase RidA (YjgF/YER057c/UK114 family)
MTKRSVEIKPSFKLFTLSVHDQLYLTVSVNASDADPYVTAGLIYARITEILRETSMRIVHERLFGNLELFDQIVLARSKAFQAAGLEHNGDAPLTYIEGRSCIGAGFSGIQIRAVHPAPGKDAVRTLREEGRTLGRAWTRQGAVFIMLQNIDGKGAPSESGHDRASRAEAMFRQAERLLRSQGASYRDVARTWIYIDDILDWYGEFNVARNQCYSDIGFLGDPSEEAEAERLYLPASTGIEGKNREGAPAVMDVFAVHGNTDGTIRIRPISGTRQRSPFRYGSAFSRAMVVEEPDSKLILVSGTASIDEQGRTVYLDDTDAQIRHTLNVVSALIAEEGATLQDLCEATVFLKRSEDFPIYVKVAAEFGLSNAPSVNVVADVCRDDLLFELDAAFISDKKKPV